MGFFSCGISSENPTLLTSQRKYSATATNTT
jgi:hypothetical protein